MKQVLLLLMVFCAVNVRGQIITTIAGSGHNVHSGDNGLATNSSITDAGFGVFDKFGNYYFVEGAGNRIRKISIDGNITTFAGTGVYGFGGDSGPATAARFRAPKQIAVDTVGNVFITDDGNSRVRKVDISTGFINTIAGDGSMGYFGENVPATDAQIGAPYSLCFDPLGNLYIGDQTYNIIRKIDGFGMITTIAGTPGVISYAGDGGPATAAELISLEGICSDKDGNLYIITGDIVRKITVTTGIISTVAGNRTTGYSGDNNPATNAALNAPIALGFDDFNTLYIADTKNNRIRRVDTFGIITTVVGNGIAGFLGDNGPATNAQIYWPEGIAFDSCGNLFFNDLSNFRIRRVDYSHCGTLLVNPINSSQIFNISPNPCKSLITITHNISDINITDITGQTLFTQTYTTTKAEIDMSGYPAGVYIVRVRDKDGGQIVRKVVKE